MDISQLRGVGPALITPLHADGSIDFDAYREHVEFQIEGGVDFLVPCGTTGESATLSTDEQADVIRACVEAADGRVPVVAGAGTNVTEGAGRMACDARDAGADAILSITPYYNKPTQEGLYRHFRSVAEACGIPVVVYNVPGRTGSNIEAATVLRLARDVENVVAVKEASGDLQQVMTILRERPDGFLVLSGEDHLTFPLVCLGGDGVISVVANEVPDLFSEMVHAALEGRTEQARAMHYRMLPLMRANFVETNPIPVKRALEMMGRLDAHYRLPLVPLTEASEEELREALRMVGALA